MVTDMKKHFVIDPLIGKRQQLMLATQLCRMVLKVRLVLSLYLFPMLQALFQIQCIVNFIHRTFNAVEFSPPINRV